MMNDAEFYIPAPNNHGDRIWLSKPISAIQLVPTDDGGAKLGLLSHLGPGVTVELCGKGFDERTAKVRASDHYYFVFLEDLHSQRAAAAS